MGEVSAWWGQLLTCGRVASVAAPFGMFGLDLSCTEHECAIVLGLAGSVVGTLPATRLYRGDFVGQNRCDLRRLAIMLPLLRNSALRSQQRSRAFMTEPSAEAECFEQYRRDVSNCRDPFVSDTLVRFLDLALPAKLHELGASQIAQRTLRAAQWQAGLLREVRESEVDPTVGTWYANPQRRQVTEFDHRTCELHTCNAPFAALLTGATVLCVQASKPLRRLVEISAEAHLQLAQDAR
jgi:hypothetical protein